MTRHDVLAGGAKSLLVGSIALVLGVCPGSPGRSFAEGMRYIRVATLVPRDSDLARSFLKLDRALRDVSNNAWGLRLYPGGVAGDEPDVMRKMKVGQMDASIITTTGLSHIVKEIAVLDSPGVVRTYAQLDAVTAALAPEWTRAFASQGFKLVGWSEAGQYRWFSKTAIRRPADLRDTRPWLWPASFILKEIYRVIGCNGVPLGVPEVYGALQTGMVDAVISTASALVALQWHSRLKHMTKDTFGVLINGLVMNQDKWNALPADVAQRMQSEATKIMARERSETRRADVRSYDKLKQRGYVADDWAPGGYQEYLTMEKEVRARLVGRLYSSELLSRVMKIAASADSAQTASAAAAHGPS